MRGVQMLSINVISFEEILFDFLFFDGLIGFDLVSEGLGTFESDREGVD
jgi:hypothetical protein